jgi:cytidylate kinase
MVFTDTAQYAKLSKGQDSSLDAEPEERAHRRVLQLRERGVEADEAEVLALTLERDKNDRERAISPLKQADQALRIDSTHHKCPGVCLKIRIIC